MTSTADDTMTSTAEAQLGMCDGCCRTGDETPRPVTTYGRGGRRWCDVHLAEERRKCSEQNRRRGGGRPRGGAWVPLGDDVEPPADDVEPPADDVEPPADAHLRALALVIEACPADVLAATLGPRLADPAQGDVNRGFLAGLAAQHPASLERLLGAFWNVTP